MLMKGTSIATEMLMERFLQYLLAHPERFARSEVPCCLQALWEEALTECSEDAHMRLPEGNRALLPVQPHRLVS